MSVTIDKPQIPKLVNINNSGNKNILYGWRDCLWLTANLQSLRPESKIIPIYRITRNPNIYNLSAIIKVDTQSNAHGFMVNVCDASSHTMHPNSGCTSLSQYGKCCKRVGDIIDTSEMIIMCTGIYCARV